MHVPDMNNLPALDQVQVLDPMAPGLAVVQGLLLVLGLVVQWKMCTREDLKQLLDKGILTHNALCRTATCASIPSQNLVSFIADQIENYQLIA